MILLKERLTSVLAPDACAKAVMLDNFWSEQGNPPQLESVRRRVAKELISALQLI